MLDHFHGNDSIVELTNLFHSGVDASPPQQIVPQALAPPGVNAWNH